MKDVTLVYPHQLFRSQPALTREREVLLLEDPHFFTRFPFHQQKLVLHRASLQFYHDHLRKQGFRVTYIPLDKAGDMVSLLKGCASVHVADPIEHDLGDRLAQAARKAGARLVLYDTPAFVIDRKTIDEEMGGRRRYFMEGFYEKWRKRLGILTKGGQPVGGRWSYDPENRQPLPESVQLPTPWRPAANAHVREAISYVQKRFGRNYGRAEEFGYAVTFADAGRWLDDFVEHRLQAFGPYEDAMRRGEVVLYHSQLSHLLNIGLLTPQQVLEAALQAAKGRKVPINSLEGFVRQILGWREFMRAVYRLKGKEQKQANLFGHRRKLPDQFWQAQTGLEPLDDTISRVLQHAYCHHIERLMVLGAVMLLCEIAPDEVYRWGLILKKPIYIRGQYAASSKLPDRFCWRIRELSPSRTGRLAYLLYPEAKKFQYEAIHRYLHPLHRQLRFRKFLHSQKSGWD